MMNNYESTEQIGAGTGGGLQGAIIDRFRRTKNPAIERKAVTFGDGTAVVGNPTFSLLTVLALFLLWVFAEAIGLTNDTFFPGPVKTADEFWTVLTTDSFNRAFLHEHVLKSLQRILIGFGAGVLLGVPVGLAMGLSNIARAVFDPIIELFRPVPPLAFIPLLILWFGIGETSKNVMLFFAAFFIMVIAARSGVTGVRISKVHAAYSLGASKFQILRHVVIPNALPEIFVGMRVALGVCWGTLVAAELVGADVGLGAMIWQARTFFRNGIVVFGIIVIGIIGVILDLFMRKLEDRFIPWRGKG
jgi:taurine transport system permease protein